MTTLQEGIKAYIEAQVTAAGHGFPIEIPVDEDIPAWSYKVVDDEQLLSHSGGTGFYKARLQLEFHADEAGGKSDYENAQIIAAAARTALDGYKGSMSGLQVAYCKTTYTDDWADIQKLPLARFDVLINYKA
jgi:hypothetical protein